jgi:hypothetical protein
MPAYYVAWSCKQEQLYIEVRTHLLLTLIVAGVYHAEVHKLAKVEAPVEALVVALKLTDRLPLWCVCSVHKRVHTVHHRDLSVSH